MNGTRNRQSLRDSFRTKTFRAGGYSVLAAALVIAVAVLLNLIVGKLPGSMTQKDLSASGMFTLSPQTETLADTLDAPVTVYWIVTQGNEDTYLSALLEQYEGLNQELTVERIDPVVYPNFAGEYTDEAVTMNSLIVVSETRSCYVPYETLYQYDYTNYYSTGKVDVQFAGESEITRAIDYVNKSALSKAYVLTGHGESPLPAVFSAGLRNLNLETESLNLLTVSQIPDDADCILLLNPTADLSESESALLLQYLSGGGSLLLMTGCDTGDAFPNLSAVTRSYGVSTQTGIVVEGDPSRCLANYPHYLLPELQNHPITQPLSDGGYNVVVPFSGTLTIESVPEGVSVTSLLRSSSASYAKSDSLMASTMEQEPGDSVGPFDLAVAVSQESTGAQFVWFSSAMLATDTQANSLSSGANLDLFLNAISWMCGQSADIGIHTKTVDTNSLTVSAGAATTLTILLCFGLPAVCLILGAVVVIRRRKRR